MHIALLFLSFSQVWGTWAVPAGLPYYVGAAGNFSTCAAQGFIGSMLAMTVPIYYGSLVLQAYLGIKNNFQEENYRWIEYPVHCVAYSYACALISVIVATDNMNPGGTGCFYGKSPRGCESDPDVPCERGEDIGFYIYVVMFSQLFLYLLFPPSVILFMYWWIKRRGEESAKRFQGGMSNLRNILQKQIMQSIFRQISIYLCSFWFTWVFLVIHMVYKILSGNPAYNWNIFANCIFALQGFVYMLVYFALDRMGRPNAEHIVQQSTTANGSAPRRHRTVDDIRASVLRISENVSLGSASKRISQSFDFNVFDGTPDENSPWAMFIDPDSDEEESVDGSNEVSIDVHKQYDGQHDK